MHMPTQNLFGIFFNNIKKGNVNLNFQGGGGMLLTLYQLGIFFQNVILFLDIVPHNCNY